MLRRKLNSDSGFTLVELIVAASITALIAVVIVRIAADSSKGLERSLSELKSNSQVVNFVRNIRYDISGSTDLFAFDKNTPTAAAQNYLCSSWTSAKSWTDPAAGNFVRELFSVAINDLEYVASQPVDGNSSLPFLPVVRRWAGYEIRGDNGNYSIWRVSCKDSGGTPDAITDSRKLIDLGSNLDPNVAGTGVPTVVGVPDPWFTITCNNVVCPTASSTATLTSYAFALPYTPSASAAPSGDLQLRQFSNDSTYGASSYLKSISRRVRTL